LYHRFNVIELRLPPLPDRPAEIPALTATFIEQAAATHSKRALELTQEAAAALIAYSWPGNVRELRNVLERAVVLSRGDKIRVNDLPDRILAGPQTPPARNLTLEELERRHIQFVLEQAMTLEEAAEMLGINVPPYGASAAATGWSEVAGSKKPVPLYHLLRAPNFAHR
jgi:DNA-binding NtrC family response regulator